MFKTIVAIDLNNGIGYNGNIPWYEPEDLKHFKKTTMGHIIIMGRLTYDSIIKNRIDNFLPGRINCIISKKLDDNLISENIKIFRSCEDCVVWCNNKILQEEKKNNNIIGYVIGGGTIYKWFLENKLISEEIITKIPTLFPCDTYYRGNKNDNYKIIKEYKSSYINNIQIISKKIINKKENEILEMMENILINGNIKNNRTGIDTLSLFGQRLEFSINKYFPLLTTRKMFFRGIVEELLFFLRGETNTKILEQKGINIWKGNTSREFLDNKGLYHLPEGSTGHSYGWSFRHFGADMKIGGGFDQLKWLINEIKNNPDSRRLIISLWEPNFMKQAALPPCLYNYQFYINNNYLSCMMTQRSSDFALAGGWNIGTGALLTYIIAYYTNLKPDKLIWNIGDVHIYKNMIEGIKEQITRTPNIFPKLKLQNMPINFEELEYKNFKLLNYRPHLRITLPMNI